MVISVKYRASPFNTRSQRVQKSERELEASKQKLKNMRKAYAQLRAD